MRKILFSLVPFLFFANTSLAQKVAPTVINASGGSAQVPSQNIFLDWSVAEMTVVNTMVASASPNKVIVLTNGFLQPDKAHDNIHLKPDLNTVLTGNDIKVYPNPTVNYVEVQFYAGLSGKTQLTLFDVSGTAVYNRSIQLYGKGSIERIPLQNLTAGTYLLQVYMNSETGMKKGTFKIIKMN